MNINWKQKLSSRKFWLTVAGFITAVLAAFNVDDMTTNQIATIISALGAIVIYVIGESTIDAKRVQNESKETDINE